MKTHTAPDGTKWVLKDGYNGHKMREDGSMYFDVHTGRGKRKIWKQVVEPRTCPVCGDHLPWDFHAELNHKADCGVPLD